MRRSISLAETAARIQEMAPAFDPKWVRSLTHPWPDGPRTVNRIEVIRAPSKFVLEPHLNIFVDGVPLDVALGDQAEGLVSSLLGWFHNDADSAVPWQRILPDIGCTAYAPVLICPDDLDLFCSVVMAEVVSEPDAIRWDKLGFSANSGSGPGSCVRWESSWGPYRFDRAEYEACLASFRTLAG